MLAGAFIGLGELFNVIVLSDPRDGVGRTQDHVLVCTAVWVALVYYVIYVRPRRESGSPR
jgi:hypothetical protein